MKTEIWATFNQGAEEALTTNTRTDRKLVFACLDFLRQYTIEQIIPNLDAERSKQVWQDLSGLQAYEGTQSRELTCSTRFVNLISSARPGYKLEDDFQRFPPPDGGKRISAPISGNDRFSSSDIYSTTESCVSDLVNLTWIVRMQMRSERETLALLGGLRSSLLKMMQDIELVTELARNEESAIGRNTVDSPILGSGGKGRNIHSKLTDLEKLALRALWHIEFEGKFGKDNPLFNEFNQSTKKMNFALRNIRILIEKSVGGFGWRTNSVGRLRKGTKKVNEVEPGALLFNPDPDWEIPGDQIPSIQDVAQGKFKPG